MARKRNTTLIVLAALLIPLFLTACSEATQKSSVSYDDLPYSEYGAALQELFPAQEVARQSIALFPGLNQSVAMEAFDTQAAPALQAGLAGYWYPQYLSTVVIAVDRDQTSVNISGWGDLASSGERIAMTNQYPYLGHILAAVSYGLDGEDFSLHSAARVLSQAYSRGNLTLGRYDAPVLVCFDDHAAAMVKAGRNMEIIVPKEGTLNFEKGLLSHSPLDMPDGRNALLGAGFRLLDGTCDESLYPPPMAYLRTVTLKSYTHLNGELQSVTKILEREIQRMHMYTPVDGPEHQLLAILYMVMAILWIGSISYRAMQDGVRRPALICGVLMIGWMLLRTLKYSLPSADPLIRYAWYGYYIFELNIPLVLLWMALVIDKPESTQKPPKWWVYLAEVNVILALLVLTNDLHQLAFRMDLTGSDWVSNYSYGPVYFAAIGAIALQVLFSQIIMVKKCRNSPRKFVFLLPIAMYLFLSAYGIAYVLRSPFIMDIGLSITVGIFALIYMEACVQIGLVPVNRNYRQFFEQSPQSMQIIRDTGESALLSASATPLEKEAWQQLSRNPGKPLGFGNHTLVFGDTIHGGMVVWHEDIYSINALNREIEASMKSLRSANAILEKEETVGRNLAAAKAEIALFSGMETTIRRHTEELSALLRNIPALEGRKEYLTRVATMVCYIKRRCQLFFFEQRSSHSEAYALAVYMDELAEFAQYAGINCRCVCTFSGSAPVAHVSLMYDFVHAMLDWLFEHSGKSMLIQIAGENSGMAVALMQSSDISAFVPNAELLAEIKATHARVSIDQMEGLGSIGFHLAFPEEGGCNHA